MVSVAQNPLPGVPLDESALFDFPLDNFDEVADRIKSALMKQPEIADVAEIAGSDQDEPLL